MGSLNYLTMSEETDRKYCAAQVKLYDYDRYFAAVMGDEVVQRGLFALYAFNSELAMVKERVTEPLIGEMRFQWWRDTLDGIYGGSVRDHAVAVELAGAIERFSLDRTSLERMVNGRTLDLKDGPPNSLNELEEYVMATAGEVMVNACMICGDKLKRNTALSLGKYWGFTGIIRSLQYDFRHRRVFFPNDLLRQHDLPPDGLLDSGQSEKVSHIIETLAKTFRLNSTISAYFEKPVRPAVSYLAVAGAYWRRLTTADFDPVKNGLKPSRIATQMRILKAGLIGRV
ncbi:MAG: squalene/phytoene synthase family protein [Pseudomonadota bacterium]|nr:squalene/phytoene synthase family protein [Pseudomonadota bacterium]